jgi:hypothetical protein
MWHTPALVLDMVSNTTGDEHDVTPPQYARMRVPYSVMYDPQTQSMDDVFTISRLTASGDARQDRTQFPALKPGLTLWEGTFEHQRDTWLRWTDEHGTIMLTGQERTERAEERAELARQDADQERQRADQEHRVLPMRLREFRVAWAYSDP